MVQYAKQKRMPQKPDRERRFGAVRAGCTLVVLLLLLAAVCVGIYKATTRGFPLPSQHSSESFACTQNTRGS